MEPQDQKPSLGERFGQGLDRALGEMGGELKRLAVLGAYEAGAALQAFPPGESAYRGDLGMLSSQAGQTPQGQAGPQMPQGLDALQAAGGEQAHLQAPPQQRQQSQSL